MAAPGYEVFFRPVSIVQGATLSALLGDPAQWSYTHRYLHLLSNEPGTPSDTWAGICP